MLVSTGEKRGAKNILENIYLGYAIEVYATAEKLDDPRSSLDLLLFKIFVERFFMN